MSMKTSEALAELGKLVSLKTLRETALPLEREQLHDVYERLLKFSNIEPLVVRHALYIETLNDYDYRKWPTDFQLSGTIDLFQQAILVAPENHLLDFFQRSNYLQLALAGCNRHRDVAFGLSDVLDWSHEADIVAQLLAMGRREYAAAVPTAHEMDNYILHVAVSYRHSGRYDNGGTMSPAQASAVWRAVRANIWFEHAQGVRVWLDQNLHRVEDHTAEWHELGLLPYACLPVVYVGDGDCSVRHADERPWLWVELLAGLKANGILTAPGHDVLRNASSVLEPTELFSRASPESQRLGYYMSSNRDVDDVMDEVCRLVAFWRPQEFLNHEGYEYAEDFLRFVNWARRYVLRGTRYSQMRKGHGSEPVLGMDAIALVRALTREASHSFDAQTALLQPKMCWKCNSGEDTLLTVGDLFDRTNVDKIPVHAIMEVRFSKRGNGTDVILQAEGSTSVRMRFRREGGYVSIVTSLSDVRNSPQFSRKTTWLLEMLEKMKVRADLVRLSASTAEGLEILTYNQITSRAFLSTRQGCTAVGDAEMTVEKAPSEIVQALELVTEGICINYGICEEVYKHTGSGGASMLFSKRELLYLLYLCEWRLSDMLKTAIHLKHCASYKKMLYDDLSEDEKFEMLAGWPIPPDVAPFSGGIVSGERSDVRTHLIEAFRGSIPQRILVTVQAFTDEEVQIVFRQHRTITYIKAPKRGVSWGMFLVDGREDIELSNESRTGVLQVLAGVRSGREGEAKEEESLKMANGLFATCTVCNELICCVNGLVTYLEEDGDLYTVRWGRSHDCGRPRFEYFQTASGHELRMDALPIL